MITFWNLLKGSSGCHVAPPRVVVASSFLPLGVTWKCWGVCSGCAPRPGVQSKATVQGTGSKAGCLTPVFSVHLLSLLLSEQPVL